MKPFDKAIEEINGTLLEAQVRKEAEESAVAVQTDPATDPVEVARERAGQLVTNISSHSMEQLRQMRDEIDNLMRKMRAQQDDIQQQIVQHAELARATIRVKDVVTDSLKTLQGGYDKEIL